MRQNRWPVPREAVLAETEPAASANATQADLFQIERIKPFGEPAIDRSEKLASFIALPLQYGAPF
jgi:hypothetical protein